MQPIEKYGVIALIFLVIVVVAAYVWDGDAAAAPSGAAAAAEAELTQAPNPLVVRARTEPRPVRRSAELTAEEVERARALVAAGDELPPEVAQRVAKRLEAERLAALVGAPAEVRPTGAHAAQPAAPTHVPEERIYVVRKGDTLSEISQSVLGTSKRWREIVERNPGLDPTKLREGVRLVMPERDAGAAGAPAAVADAAPAAAQAPDRGASAAPPAAADATPGTRASGATGGTGPTHVVRANESLWTIAAAELGRGERWREIAARNPKVDPDRLTVGTVLVLPSDAAPAPAPREAPTVAAATPPAKPAARERKGVVR